MLKKHAMYLCLKYEKDKDQHGFELNNKLI